MPGTTSKTLFLPNTTPDDSSLSSLLDSLHCRTEPPVLRPEVLEEVTAELLTFHPLKGGNTAAESRALVNNLLWRLREVEGVVWVREEQKALMGPTTTYHFSSLGPTSQTLFSVLIPNSTTISAQLRYLAG